MLLYSVLFAHVRGYGMLLSYNMMISNGRIIANLGKIWLWQRWNGMIDTLATMFQMIFGPQFYPRQVIDNLRLVIDSVVLKYGNDEA